MIILVSEPSRLSPCKSMNAFLHSEIFVAKYGAICGSCLVGVVESRCVTTRRGIDDGATEYGAIARSID